MTIREELTAKRYSNTRWRVMVFLNGKPQFYNTYTIEELADRYADQMREIYRDTGLPVFVKKEILSAKI